MKHIKISSRDYDLQDGTDWATEAHEGQTRKSTNLPYITHPIGVGDILKSHGFDSSVVLAGILHDTIEDTSVTYEDIVNKFGQEVADIVAEVSEDKSLATWEERKQGYKNNLSVASREARAVACADKIHNMQDTISEVTTKGQDAWGVFKRPPETIMGMYEGYVPIFQDLGGIFAQFTETLEALKAL